MALRQGHHPRAPEVVLPVVGPFKCRLGLALSPPECSIHFMDRSGTCQVCVMMMSPTPLGQSDTTGFMPVLMK